MKNIIDGMNVLDQTPIKHYTTLSGIITWSCVGLIILAVALLIIKTRSKKEINFKDRSIKRILFLYLFGIVASIFSVIRFPWFYAETGRYTYKCTLEDDVSANYISNNFNIIGVTDGVWTIEDKE